MSTKELKTKVRNDQKKRGFYRGGVKVKEKEENDGLINLYPISEEDNERVKI